MKHLSSSNSGPYKISSIVIFIQLKYSKVILRSDGFHGHIASNEMHSYLVKTIVDVFCAVYFRGD